MDQDLLQCSHEGRTAIVRLNNPPVNVINTALRAQFKQALKDLANNNDVTTIIITGEGKSFMAGADIRDFPNMIGKARAAYEFVYDAYEPWFLLENIEKPTIAAINGLALGAGLEMALCCDIRIAAENSKLGLPEIKLGLFPGGGGTQRLARLIGTSKTKELIYSGESVTASQALELGIVNQVVPEGKALSQALALAARFNQFSLVALSAAKRAINLGNNVSLREGIEIEAQEFERVFHSDDIKEGVKAFLTKQTPFFKNK